MSQAMSIASGQRSTSLSSRPQTVTIAGREAYQREPHKISPRQAISWITLGWTSKDAQRIIVTIAVKQHLTISLLTSPASLSNGTQRRSGVILWKTTAPVVSNWTLSMRKNSNCQRITIQTQKQTTLSLHWTNNSYEWALQAPRSSKIQLLTIKSCSAPSNSRPNRQDRIRQMLHHSKRRLRWLLCSSQTDQQTWSFRTIPLACMTQSWLKPDTGQIQ